MRILAILCLVCVNAHAGTLSSAVAAWTNGPFLSVTGDSIAEGHTGYHSIQHLGPSGDTNYNIADVLWGLSTNLIVATNFGHGSQMFNNILTDDVGPALAVHPKYLLVHCGVNDVSGGRTWAQVLADLNTLNSRCVASNSLLILDDIMPWTSGTDANALTIRTWNTNFTQWASTSGVYRLTSHDYFGVTRISTGYLDDQNPSYGTGLHMITNGYYLWGRLILTNLMELENTTWYVRPGVYSAWDAASPGHPIADAGIYGYQSGLNYDDAWNGIQSIVWGGTGVKAGDTIYLCGAHIYHLSNASYSSTQARIPIGASGVTIRMDYAPDPGLVFGGSYYLLSTITWDGPDANGVYRTTNTLADPYGWYYEIAGTNITRLSTTNTSSWAGGLGSWFNDGASNYVKTTTGSAPTTNIAFNADGWSIEIPVTVSNVTFQSCTFIGGGIYIEAPTYSDFLPPENYAANHITFKDCSIRDCDATQVSQAIMFSLSPGHDNWRFEGCDIGYGPSGIYTGMATPRRHRGVIGTVITNCYIHDMDSLSYPAADGHGIGAQDVVGSLFVNNRLERTGTAIALFSWGYGMSNNLVARNFVRNVHTHNDGLGQTGGEGIWVSCGASNVCPGNQIIANIVQNTGILGVGAWEAWMGSGISVSPNDYIEILNNTVVNADQGINVQSGVAAPNVKIENNIVYNATNVLIKVGNSAPVIFTCDYNLFYTNANPGAVFSFSGSPAHDTHSVYGDPMFASASPSVALDFIPSIYGPAKAAGTSIGAVADYRGTIFGNPPTIGAFEIGAPSTATAVNATVTHMSGQ